MGHEIRYADYAENVNQKKVQDDWNNYVAHEDWQEGASGASPIRWINQPATATKQQRTSSRATITDGMTVLLLNIVAFQK